MGRFALIIAGIGCAASVIGSLHRLSHQPAASDLERAAQHVHEAWADGDVLLIDPITQAGPRSLLGDLEILDARPLLEGDFLTHGRIHFIDVDVVGRDPATADLLAQIGQPELSETFGVFTVRRYGRPKPGMKLLDLHRDIERLSVSARYPDGKVAPCDRFDIDRWNCPKDPEWSYVGRKIIENRALPRQCVWMHPLARGGVLSVALPTLPEGPKRAIGGFGFTDHAAKSTRGTVKVRINRGDEAVYEGSHAPQVGWQPFDQLLPTEALDLTLAVTANDNGAAHFCVDLKVVQG